MTTTVKRFDVGTARVNAGYGIRGFARKIGLHEATLRRLEDGLPVRPENAKPVADFFGIKVTDLMPSEHDSPRAAA